ncbi:crotonase/enoyl-CoA hydratase family protein [Bradyrhizobium sp. SSUT18]|uniref:crotonase/enoyl-CoA hydratase family protein n=1 Tax=Bradyrhizobium sp. SSUT18 TaxID=3040602 RepID=UPI0024487A94|nr:crotonase/enoyl-CoA hydratase family protein [Bradyrhizobium sp. SSUT18]MDH2406805.1 crotonase/enoyl-CoA hydratase family protein [Bradyrhizobium sp. SSUT18]
MNPLEIEYRDNIAILTLNRPDKRNALNDQTIDALSEFFASPPEHAAVVILQGAGEHFCAGLDLAELISKNRTPEQVIRHSRGWHRTFDLIQYGDVPVISCLKGGVIGGGLELAAATHIRICEPSTFFQLPEGQRGIFLGGGGSVRIPRIIGTGRVVEMMLTGRRFDADEGIRLGLGHRTAPAGRGLDCALELAKAVAANLPTSNYAIINGIARISEMSAAEGLFAETMTALMTGSALKSRDRIREFLDRKREPNATGAAQPSLQELGES